MGYLIGGRIVNTDRYGKSKNINQNQGLIKVPEFKPIRGASFDKSQDFKARIRTQAADISRTAPTFNDPRYTFTTLSIPTDLRTLNGLYRFFDDTDPIVGNAIRLHTEFPLAGYGFSTCGDPGIQAHFEEMWDRIHGDQLLFDLGLEYWRIGNVFLFGAWNEVDFMWDQFAVLNPDYVTVDSTWLNQKPLIKLQPDEALKRIVSSGQPKFLYNQLSPEIIKFVRLGQEIPLDPNNTFFIAHNKAPYENLGKSIIKRILKMLIYEDRLNMANFSIATRQVIPITIVKMGDAASGWVPEADEMEAVKEMFACYDEQTEVLTESGFKHFKDILPEDKIGCFNSNTKELEYHLPTEKMEYDYDGEMIQFKTGKIDLLVTPNHKMYLKRLQHYSKDTSWKIQYANDVRVGSQFCSTIDWAGEKPPEFIKIKTKQIPSKIFFEFMGWFLSEGCVGLEIHGERKYPHMSLSQNETNVRCLEKVMCALPYKCGKSTYKIRSGNMHTQFDMYGELTEYMLENFPGGASKKYVPKWMLKADKEYLEILLNALMAGDGSWTTRKKSVYGYYASSSKQLAEDVYEIAFKLGYAPTLNVVEMSKKNPKWKDSYRINFSNSNLGNFPWLIRNRFHKTPITKVSYKGKVWCFTVPTSFFIVRRNGKISIQSNSREVDPNFTIFYHYGIDVQFYGASGKILNLTPEHDRIRKLKFLGLGISEALLSGGTATYATAYMNLEVLRQRYLHFQLRLENFVHKGLFEVVARLCGFYQTDKTVVGKNYKGKVYGDAKAMKNFMEQRFAQKTLRDLQDNFEFKEFIRKKAQEDAENGLAIRPKYIYPRLKWDLLSLTSDAQYRQFLMSFDKMFPGVRKISDSTYYRVLKLDGDLEQRQIEVEKQEQRDQQFKDAKKDKEFREKLISEGLELPPTQPGKTVGVGGPTMPVTPLPPAAPRAPIGKGVAEGEGKPGGGPEVLREKSKEMQTELEEGLEAEVKRLKKSNEEMLKNRDTEN